jgi:hypothetical protein
MKVYIFLCIRIPTPKNLIDTKLTTKQTAASATSPLCRILENEGITRGMEKVEYLVLLFESGHSFITYFFKNMQVLFLENVNTSANLPKVIRDSVLNTFQRLS